MEIIKNIFFLTNQAWKEETKGGGVGVVAGSTLFKIFFFTSTSKHNYYSALGTDYFTCVLYFYVTIKKDTAAVIMPYVFVVQLQTHFIWFFFHHPTDTYIVCT